MSEESIMCINQGAKDAQIKEENLHTHLNRVANQVHLDHQTLLHHLLHQNLDLNLERDLGIFYIMTRKKNSKRN